MMFGTTSFQKKFEAPLTSRLYFDKNNNTRKGLDANKLFNVKKKHPYIHYRENTILWFHQSEIIWSVCVCVCAHARERKIVR